MPLNFSCPDLGHTACPPEVHQLPHLEIVTAGKPHLDGLPTGDCDPDDGHVIVREEELHSERPYCEGRPRVRQCGIEQHRRSAFELRGACSFHGGGGANLDVNGCLRSRAAVRNRLVAGCGEGSISECFVEVQPARLIGQGGRTGRPLPRCQWTQPIPSARRNADVEVKIVRRR